MRDLVSAYIPPNDEEALHKQSILELLEVGSRCFFRDHFDPGHITGSGLLISHDGNRVLMNHHKSLDKWVCFGGHADGDEDVMRVAMREVIEESGIESIEPMVQGIFDVDVHAIPFNPKKNEPAHGHYDIRYIFRTATPEAESFNISDESLSLRWCSYDEARALIKAEDSMERLLAKWHGLA